MSMMPLRLYALATVLADPLLRWHLARRAARGKEVAARLDERFGIETMARPQGRLVWLHAASVGETVSVLPVIEALLREADVTVLVTTGTVTSAELLAERVAAFAAPGRVLHRFVPLDVRHWVHRFVLHWQADVVGFVESEIWPNLLRTAKDAGIPRMLVNGRLSEGSFRLWQRLPGTARILFGLFDAVQAQSAADAARLSALGARDVQSPGNLKHGAAPLPVDAGALDRLRAMLAGRPVWLAASTHPGEEAIAAAVHRALVPDHPGLVTIIAPRHPVRGDEIAAALGDLTVTRRSRGEDPPAEGVWLVDTLGEMGLPYRLAPIAFVGCSLAVGGGHNPFEAARLGCAAAMGPMVANCREAVARLAAVGALETVGDAAGLTSWVDRMLRDPAGAAASGAHGMDVARGDAGLAEQVAARLLALIQ